MCGGVAIVVLVIVALLAMRVRRRRCAQRQQRQHINAVSNEQYGVGLFPDYKGSSTKPPDYTPPTNPPAYDELNNPVGQDYKFANPPLYDELSLAGGDKTETDAGENRVVSSGIYEDVEGVERIGVTVSNLTYGSAIAEGFRTPSQTDL